MAFKPGPYVSDTSTGVTPAAPATSTPASPKLPTGTLVNPDGTYYFTNAQVETPTAGQDRPYTFKEYIAIAPPEELRILKLNAEQSSSSGPMTPEAYYNARGGVMPTGYFADSYIQGMNLTLKERNAAITGAVSLGLTGSSLTGYLAMAERDKQTQYYMANPDKIQNPILRVSVEMGDFSAEQLKVLLNQGIGSRGPSSNLFKSDQQSIAAVRNGQSIQANPIGMLPGNKPFYGVDDKGQPITERPTVGGSNITGNAGFAPGGGALDAQGNLAYSGNAGNSSGNNAGGNSGGSTGGNTGTETPTKVGGFDAEGNFSPTGMYNFDGTPVGGTNNTSGGTSGNQSGRSSSGSSSNSNTNDMFASNNSNVSNEKRDAFALISATLKNYGFTNAEMQEIDKFLKNTLVDPAIGPNQALLLMRQLKSYKDRFAGNEALLKAGKNVLSEADYLQQEKDYGTYLKAWGIPEVESRALSAALIGGSVAPTELNKRLELAVARVKNSDPEIMSQLQGYYGITQKDMVKYVLQPKEMLPELERKVTSAEIGSAAKAQGLAYDKARAEGLEAYGINRAGAIEGYSNVGAVLPSTKTLSEIYSETGMKYNQDVAEAEFFKGDAGAAQKRKGLKSLERAQFSGSSGVSQQAGSLSRSTQGSF